MGAAPVPAQLTPEMEAALAEVQALIGEEPFRRFKHRWRGAVREDLESLVEAIRQLRCRIDRPDKPALRENGPWLFTAWLNIHKQRSRSAT